MKEINVESAPNMIKNEAGFSILESIVGIMIITISLLGALQAINYSVVFNAGNATRAQNLAILQQEVERLRAAKFTMAGIDQAPLPGDGTCRADAERDITGGEKPACLLAAPNGGLFQIKTFVDDNPFNGPGSPDDVDPTSRVKEITVEVGLAAPTPGWQTAIPARVVLRRTVGN